MKKIIFLLKKYQTFIKYMFSAGISFAIDLGLFTLFSFLLKNYINDEAVFVATILARVISSFINYFLNRNAVFKSNGKAMDFSTLVKYYTLVVIQMFVSATLVLNLYKMFHIYEALIKIPVEVVLFMINYIVQKKFIFVENSKKDKKKLKINYNFLCVLGGILTTFSLLFQVTSKTLKFHRSNTMIVTYVVLAIALICFYKKYLYKFKSKITYRIISLIFSLLMVFGYSYDIVHNASLVLGSFPLIIFSILKLIGYYLLFSTVIHLFDDIVTNGSISINDKVSKIWSWFNRHPFLYSFIFIFICYLPYIVAFYPVIINYDAANQIKEVMGIHTRYMDSVILLNPSITITNFNPIIHTFLIGGLFKFGYSIGNVNFGMFLYSIIQVLIVISIFAYSIYYLNKEKVNKVLIFITLLIYSLVPLFAFYSITAVKDVIFSSLILLYVIKIYDIIKYKQSLKKYILFGLLILLIILFRNNGMYTILLSLPFLLFKKEIRIPIFIVLVCNICLYLGYNKVLLPHFEIANTSIREVLSVPFQQTARHVKYYPSDITDEDKMVIDKVLGYDTLGDRYDTGLSDPVKNEYNKYTTDEELSAYFKVWGKYLLKRPVVYIDATINNIYGYFYPNTSKWYIYTELNEKLKEAGFDYHFNGLSGLRMVLAGYGEAFPYIPIVGSIANIGLVVWAHILLIGMLIVHKMKKYIILLTPSISLILTCVVGPANTYFRYILPCVFALPVIVCVLYNELKNN